MMRSSELVMRSSELVMRFSELTLIRLLVSGDTVRKGLALLVVFFKIGNELVHLVLLLLSFGPFLLQTLYIEIIIF